MSATSQTTSTAAGQPLGVRAPARERVAALVVDLGLPACVTAAVLVVGPAGAERWPWVAAGGALLFAIAVASSMSLTGGDTAGKALFGLRVQHAPRAAPIGFWWAFTRCTVGYVVFDVCGYGALPAASRRRPLHDLVFASDVVTVAGGSDPRARLVRFWTIHETARTRRATPSRWLFAIASRPTWLSVLLAHGALSVLGGRRHAAGAAPVGHPAVTGASEPHPPPLSAPLPAVARAAIALVSTAVTGAGILVAVLNSAPVTNDGARHVPETDPPSTTEATTHPGEVVVPDHLPHVVGDFVPFVAISPIQPGESVDSEIFLIPIEGGEVVQLTDDRVQEDHPSVFDGRRVAFNAEGRIFVVGIDGSGLHAVTDGSHYDDVAGWLPDGASLVFLRSEHGWGLDLYTIGADGTGVTRLAECSGCLSPIVSPDGRMIAFTRGLGELYVMNSDGTSERRIVDVAGAVGSVGWSPDSRRLVYDTYDFNTDTTDIYIRDLDSSAPTHVEHFPSDDDPGRSPTSPQWSPDGSRILFLNDDLEVWSTRPDGSDPSFVADLSPPR